MTEMDSDSPSGDDRSTDINEVIVDLTDVEARVLGCLVEKESTTPDVYPMTTNGLVSACNQKTSRDPVVSYKAVDVDSALLELRQKGLVRMVREQGSRSTKHRHVLDESLGLSRPQVAVLAVLFLRGPQTPGELRGRTERIHEFDSPSAVEQVLAALAGRGAVREHARQPGQKESRHGVVGSGQASVESMDAAPAGAPGHAPAPAPVQPSVAGAAPTAAPASAPAAGDRIAVLEAQLAELTRRFEALCDALGERPE